MTSAPVGGRLGHGRDLEAIKMAMPPPTANDDASRHSEPLDTKLFTVTDQIKNDDGENSLKHRLLGPSLTKAGQDTVDQAKVSEIIYEASKGSKFFANEQTRDRILTEKIKHILARRDLLLKHNLSNDLRRADEYIASLEDERDLSQSIIHIDCDAFYAAVEELDRPELKHVPFAVGKGVLTTCNYEARKFGCRSGMAGFVAKKLCPQLILVSNDFTKYTAKAQEVRAVIEKYDPRFESASIDEAYLNVTQYCLDSQMDPWETVEQLRKEVHEACKITVSAGIAANAKLAKIASNQNKPNGQFRIPSDRQSIMSFMKTLPVRKVNGVGRVFERELDAVGIKAVGDIYEHRGMLNRLFGDKAYHFLIRTYLGLGRTDIQPAEEYERKSVGTERTFAEIAGKEALREKLHALAEELEGDLKRTEFKGRTLVLKVKFNSYEVITRQMVPPFALSKKEDLEKFALPMLMKLEKEFPNMRLRLMGLRCTSLVSTAKLGVDFFNVKRKTESNEKSVKTDKDGWEIWPEDEFEDAAAAEREADLEEMEALSQEYEEARKAIGATKQEPEEQFWDCPVCGRAQPAEERVFNEHIDGCLSKQTIKEVVSEQRKQSPGLEGESSSGSTKKRGRPKTSEVTHRNVRQKAFFG